MALSDHRYPPRTILLGGPVGTPAVIVNDIVASEAITPGHMIERFSDAGTPKFRKHSDDGGEGRTFALDQSMMNRGVDDAYAAGDLVEAAVGTSGTTIWALIASGQNLDAGEEVESAGDGTLRVLASGVAIGFAVEGVDNSAGPGDARLKVELY